MQQGTLRKAAGNTAWLTAGRTLTLPLEIIALGLVARYFGPEQFGIFNYAVTITTLLLPACSLGLNDVVVKELVESRYPAGAVLGTAFAMRTMAVGLGVALALAVAGSGRLEAPIRTVFLVCFSAAVFLPFELLGSWFQSRLESRYVALARAVSKLATVLTKIAMVYAGVGLILFSTTFALEYALVAATLVGVYLARGRSFEGWRVRRSVAAHMLRLAWPLVTSGLLLAVYYRVDQVLVRTMLGPEQLGVYYAALRIVSLFQMFSPFVMASLLPLLVERLKGQPPASDRKRIVQGAFDTMTAAGYVFAVGVTLLSPVIISLVFGEAYAGATVVLAISAWNAPAWMSAQVRSQLLLIDHQTRWYNWIAVVSIACNVLLSVLLIPRFGLPGAAVATVVSAFIGSYVFGFFVPSMRDIVTAQTRAFLVPFRPGRLRELLARLQRRDP